MTDSLRIVPLERPPNATVVLPGSKSISNRAIVTAALADGRSTLTGVLFADDTWAMLNGLKGLGVGIDARPEAATVVVDGVGGVLSGGGSVDANQSGTTGRFAVPVAALGSQPVVVDGHPQLRGRPMGDLIDALRSLGVEIDELGEPGHLPVRVTGPISGTRTEIRGDASSQFISGLMLAGGVTDGLTIQLASELVSEPYVIMTAAVMEAFGASVVGTGAQLGDQWTVGGGYVGAEYAIEPDASAASYFLAAAAITGGQVRIEGLGSDSMQGDVAFAEVLGLMGADVRIEPNAVTVRGPDHLVGIDVDLAAFSDTAPTLAVVAAFAEGETTVRGIGFIRDKESDRIAGPVAELGRCGVGAEEFADGFVVRPAGQPHPARFKTYEDHRMAMAFALIGLVVDGIEIADPGCVAKTFPDYFAALDQLR